LEDGGELCVPLADVPWLARLSSCCVDRIDREVARAGALLGQREERAKLGPGGAAEARSHDERKLADLVQEMVDAFSFAAGLEDCEVETKVSKSYRGYRFKRDDPVVRFAHAALERAGYTPNYGLSGGAADANVFNERGLPCLNLANGMQDIHTPDERITVEDLEGMVEVTLALVDVARNADA
jgi:di/tripeptidase